MISEDLLPIFICEVEPSRCGAVLICFDWREGFMISRNKAPSSLTDAVQSEVDSLKTEVDGDRNVSEGESGEREAWSKRICRIQAASMIFEMR